MNRPGVPGLLAHLVQHVHDPGVGQVRAAGHLGGEPRHEERLEAGAGDRDGSQLLPGQGGPLRLRETEIQTGEAEHLARDHLAGTDTSGHLGVGFDHPPERCRVEPNDPLVKGTRGVWLAGPLGGRCLIGRYWVVRR